MELPAAVKAGAERAEALQKQLADRKPRDNQKGTTPRPEAQTADGTPEEGRDTSQVADVAQKQTQQTVDSPRLNSDQPQADPVKDGDEGAWKQRYLTLKGKFDAQVPKMNHEIRNLQDTVSVLEQENGQLKQAAAENSIKYPNGYDDVPMLDPDMFADYGDEFRDLAATIQTLQSENTTLKRQLSDLSGAVVQERNAQTQHAYTSYMNDVIAGVAGLGQNFDVMNSDPGFNNWLRQYPEGDIESRHAKLHRAETNLNAVETVRIFKEYLGNITSPHTGQPNIQPPASNTGTDLNPPANRSSKAWTRAQISQFYKEKTAGKYKGREEEANAIEADIFAAQQTPGRIIA